MSRKYELTPELRRKIDRKKLARKRQLRKRMVVFSVFFVVLFVFFDLYCAPMTGNVALNHSKLIVQNIINEIKMPYGGFTRTEILAYGWAAIGLGIIAALIISSRPWKNKELENFEENEEEKSEVV